MKSSGSIYLHPKNGVNPSLYQCFLCGEDIGLILFGNKAPGGGEAPRKIGAMDYDPCDKCKDWMKKGIIVISVRDGEMGSENPYRTGGWWVVREEAFRKLLHGEAMEQSCVKRVCFMEDAVCDQLGFVKESRDVKPQS